MNFERGQDPKEAMDIGIKKTLPKLLKMYRTLVVFLEENRNRPWAKEITDRVWRTRPSRFVTQYGWANMFSMFEKLDTEEYAQVFTVIEKEYKSLNLKDEL